MSQMQHPIGTPFTAAATADEVLAGIDLTGRYAVVTGGHAGIGLEVTRALAKAGVSVTIGARDPNGAAAALNGIERVEVGRLDLIDPRSVEAFAARWLDGDRPLHILVNGAGASGGPERDARGYETQFATNHLGHFQLTLALRPALCAASGARGQRVVRRAALWPHSLGRPELRHRLRPARRLCPVQGGQRAVRGRA